MDRTASDAKYSIGGWRKERKGDTPSPKSTSPLLSPSPPSAGALQRRNAQPLEHARLLRQRAVAAAPPVPADPVANGVGSPSASPRSDASTEPNSLAASPEPAATLLPATGDDAGQTEAQTAIASKPQAVALSSVPAQPKLSAEQQLRLALADAGIDLPDAVRKGLIDCLLWESRNAQVSPTLDTNLARALRPPVLVRDEASSEAFTEESQKLKAAFLQHLRACLDPCLGEAIRHRRIDLLMQCFFDAYRHSAAAVDAVKVVAERDAKAPKDAPAAVKASAESVAGLWPEVDAAAVQAMQDLAVRREDMDSDALNSLEEQLRALTEALSDKAMSDGDFDVLLGCVARHTRASGPFELPLSPPIRSKLFETLCLEVGGEHMSAPRRDSFVGFVLNAEVDATGVERGEALWGYLVARRAREWLPVAFAPLLQKIASATQLPSDVRGRLLWCVGLHMGEPKLRERVSAEGQFLDLVREVDASSRQIFERIARVALKPTATAPALELAECLYRVAAEREFAWRSLDASPPIRALLKIMKLHADTSQLGAVRRGYERSRIDEGLSLFNTLEWEREWD